LTQLLKIKTTGHGYVGTAHIDTYNYDVLLGLEFLIKIGAIVDVE
jgi:hypothetical protein